MEPSDGRPEHGRQGSAGEPSEDDRDGREQDHVDEGHEKKHPVAPVRPEIAPDRAGGDEIDEGHEPVPQPARRRASKLGADDVVPVENFVAGLHLPARPGRGDGPMPLPGGRIAQVRDHRRDVPGGLEPRGLADEAAVLRRGIVRVEPGRVEEMTFVDHARTCPVVGPSPLADPAAREQPENKIPVTVDDFLPTVAALQQPRFARSSIANCKASEGVSAVRSRSRRPHAAIADGTGAIG